PRPGAVELGDASGPASRHRLEQLDVDALVGGARVARGELLLRRHTEAVDAAVQLLAPTHPPAQRTQPGNDFRRRAELEPAGLGVLMQVSTVGDRLLLQLRGEADEGLSVDGHGPAPPRGCRTRSAGRRRATS